MNIALGTTLQINPSGTLPLKNQKYDGKIVICNLQPTKYDKKADLVISTYVDDVMEKVAKRLGVEIPEYSSNSDPTKSELCEMEWTISPELMKVTSAQHSEKVRVARKRKADEKSLRESEAKKSNEDFKTSVKKEQIEKTEEENLV